MSKKSVSLPINWLESEKGNTLLSNDDGNLVAWIKINEKHCLEVSYTPGNSPAFYVSVCDWDPVRIGQHVVEELGGWFCHRWALDDDAPVDQNSCIIGEEQ
jgi:hypothetical protein